MANLGLFHFWIGLPFNINANDRQNKFKVHTLENVTKMTNYLPKMGQDATFAQTLNDHNSVIFHPILTFNHTKMISSSKKNQVTKL